MAELQAEARATYLLAALGAAPQLFGDAEGGSSSGGGGSAGVVGLLRRAAAANSTEAHLALADRYLMGRGLAPSCGEGLRHLRLAAAAVAARVEKVRCARLAPPSRPRAQGGGGQARACGLLSGGVARSRHMKQQRGSCFAGPPPPGRHATPLLRSRRGALRQRTLAASKTATRTLCIVSGCDTCSWPLHRTATSEALP
jgi:hypothetical protein